MSDALVRATFLLTVLVPFVFFMAAVYLALHIVFARVIPGGRDSAVLWFFSVLTRPLTRPVRAVLPEGTAEPRIRMAALGLYLFLWIACRVLLAGLAPVAG
jgi:uncharacterized protein YggT (Ycf19 family)